MSAHINTGTCPKCGQVVRHVEVEPIDLHQGLLAAWNGVSYLCPECQTILSIQIDPVALKTDIVNGVIAQLKAARGRRR